MHQLPPIDDDKQFEKLIRDICRHVFNMPSFELYGKRGEGQAGIDGWHIIDAEIIAFQCKKKEIKPVFNDTLPDKIKSEMRQEAFKAKDFFKDKPLSEHTFLQPHTKIQNIYRIMPPN